MAEVIDCVRLTVCVAFSAASITGKVPKAKCVLRIEHSKNIKVRFIIVLFAGLFRVGEILIDSRENKIFDQKDTEPVSRPDSKRGRHGQVFF